MWNARLNETQSGINIVGRNINDIRYEDDSTLMAESKKEWKSLWLGERGEWKSWLKLNIHKTKIMAFCSINSWPIDGETIETLTEFIFLCSKIITECYCSHEIKRCLLIGGKSLTNLDSVLKSRNISLLTKVHLVKAMVFPVDTYRCESRTIQKAEHCKIDAFELCWKRLLRVPWTTRKFQPVNPKGNQPWIFIGRTDAEAEILILWPPDAKNWLIWKDPDAWNDWRQEEKGTTEDEMVGWHHQPSGHGFE